MVQDHNLGGCVKYEMISFLFGTGEKGDGGRITRSQAPVAASNAVPQDASNTSTGSAEEAEEDDDNSIYEDKNLEERQDEKKN